MTQVVKLVTFLNIVFVMLLAVSSTLDGVFADCVYYLAFFIPFAIGFYASLKLQHDREEVKGLAEPDDRYFNFDKCSALKLLPLIFPTVALVLLTSLFSSMAFSFFGIRSQQTADDGIIKLLIIHALMPAILEELLFRYIPIKLLLPYSKRWCILYSALCFSLIHCDFVQMPYAFVAGAVFMTVDIAFESVWPSIILHLVNNAMSVVWMKYCSDVASTLVFASLLLVLTAVSLVILILNRDEYKSRFDSATDKGESFNVTYAPILLVVICSYVAWANL